MLVASLVQKTSKSGIQRRDTKRIAEQYIELFPLLRTIAPCYPMDRP